MQNYLLQIRADHRLISQHGVRQYCYPLRFFHNAIWSPDGKYLAVGATERLGTVVIYAL